ncbi:cation:proton antiporter [Pedobacter antarcticus]|uniref:Cation:proton antiporter n=2 Tax=Pedobacter antarcticus TaxID=34086 RepID=A0A081PJZ6_9SPHI|nr:cation:proton antiporter [Pedobacter antarcticus]KEQ31019.1 cation:proton antiporter [Pedobacter antarcticus 4BY]SDM27589.1 multisubunit sodium/proton antiporter, MrpF subunit [Pedobacter antarcticus]SFF20796.1 multicomponent Na+:H+ antiporter subunit F [Pedobacter antarcticus]
MSLYTFLYYIILPVLCISVLLVFIRFLKGPHTADRVVALDLLLTIGIAIITIYSLVTDQPTFLDVAIIMALIGFLGTVAFSFYLEKREKNE